RDLETLCEQGEFRKDLYYRLNGFTINLPPLRERGNDRILLLQHFLARLNKELGREVEGIAPEALAILLEYEWPGNVRELQSVLKQAMLQCSGPALMVPHLPDSVLNAGSTSTPTERAAPAAAPSSVDQGILGAIEARLAQKPDNLYADMLAWMETELLSRVLQHSAGNQSEAARILGITRGSLRNKIRAHKISIDQVVTVDEAEDADDQS